MKEQGNGWNSALQLTHVGVQFAVIFGLCLYGGNYLDQQQGTAPLFTLLGVGFGFGAAFFHLYREVTGMGKLGQGTKPPGHEQDTDSN